MSAVKIPCTFMVRPHTRDKLDKLARQLGLSRSETICRVLSVVVDKLAHPEVGEITLSKNHLIRLLSV